MYWLALESGKCNPKHPPATKLKAQSKKPRTHRKFRQEVSHSKKFLRVGAKDQA